MTEENEEVRKSIERFYVLLKRYPDNANSAYDFWVFLRSFLRVQSKVPLPTIEVMTVLKKCKPNVFYALRKMSQRNLMLGILIELSMDNEVAEERLGKLLND